MRWGRVWMLLLMAAWPAAGQDGCDDSGIEVDGQPDGPEEPEKAPTEPGKDAPPPKRAEPMNPDDYPQPTAQNINRAIDKGVLWLKNAQHDDGSWGPCVASAHYGQPDSKGDHDCYRGGPTSFAIFTLAKCDVPARDRVIKRGLKWLHENCRPDSYRRATYESASFILMLTALYAPHEVRHPTKVATRAPAGTKFPEDDWLWLHERVQHLCVGWKPASGGGSHAACQNRGGGWRYWDSNGDQDASATQFVLLALREAVRAGYPLNEVDPDVWQDAARAVHGFQVGNGGFRYKGSYPWTAGMTAASIASLLICKEQMLLAKQPVPGWLDGSVAQGMKFLGEVFDVEKNARGEEGEEKPPGYHYYHLYGLERAGVLSGKKEFGGKAWYPRGASYLLAHQLEDGQWEDETCMRPRDVLGTCFALLFLKRATPPPAITVTGD